MGGWVEKSRSNQWAPSPGTRDGWFSQRWAVALFATRMGVLSPAILRSALARPGGYRVRSAPSASAKYSRRRDIASLMICAKNGARIASTTPTRTTEA